MLHTFFLRSPLLSAKISSHYNNFWGLNHVVAYSFTYTMVLAQFHKCFDLDIYTTTHLFLYSTL